MMEIAVLPLRTWQTTYNLLPRNRICPPVADLEIKNGYRGKVLQFRHEVLLVNPAGCI
jgi:hypothetical protein